MLSTSVYLCPIYESRKKDLHKKIYLRVKQHTENLYV